MMDPQGDGGDGESGGESDSAEGEVYDRAPRSSSSGWRMWNTITLVLI